jgi:hypothetical protein
MQQKLDPDGGLTVIENVRLCYWCNKVDQSTSEHFFNNKGNNSHVVLRTCDACSRLIRNNIAWGNGMVML